MSSSSASSSSSSSSSASTATSTDLAPPPIISSQAALYLYTFLVTLILLLTVSAAIILRTLYLRRRHRRLVEEAIRNGTYVPPIRTPRTLGAKPRLHDIVLSLGNWGDEGITEGRAAWKHIIPLGVWLSGETKSSSASELHNPSQPTSSVAASHLHWMRRRLRSVMPPMTSYTSNSAQSGPLTTLASHRDTSNNTSEPSPSIGNAYVAVLISMPTPPDYKLKLKQHQRRSAVSTSTSEVLADVGLPPVEFGVASVTYCTKEGDIKDVGSVFVSTHEGL